jgi:riboflavin biosynthesis pyrimidine reductase
VSTIDGIVAFDRAGATGGREISGGSEPDRFLMGLLRATADAVLVGAGTARASRNHAWAPARAYPPAAREFEAWRGELHLAPDGPVTVVVSATGDLDASQLGLADAGSPVLVATTVTGAGRLASLGRHARLEVVPIADGDQVPVDALVALLRERGFGLVLAEGGPTLFGRLLAAGAIDELFLTVAPQLAGRGAPAGRLGLVEGVGFAPALAPWARLQSVMRSGDHLFLRYALNHLAEKGVS